MADAIELAAAVTDKIGRRTLQAVTVAVMAIAFGCLWLVPGATTNLLPAIGLGSTSAVTPGLAESRG